MAKKKKKIKAGILKRKKEKKYKQLKQKKKNTPANNKLSKQKLTQFLQTLPLLVFEPEIEKITATKETIQAIFEKKQEMPLQILEFVSEEVYQQFLQGIKDLIERTSESDKIKLVSLQSILQFMQEDKNKQHMNQLVVAKYYLLLSKYKLIEQEITRESILEVVENYQTKYEAKLPYYKKDILQQTPDKQVEVAKVKELNPIEKLHQQVKEELTKIAKNENLDLILEDLEVFFVDFLKEKEIKSPKEITPLILKKFVSYVKQNLNPTKDDLENIKISLEYLQKILHQLNIFDSEMLQKSSKIKVLDTE